MNGWVLLNPLPLPAAFLLLAVCTAGILFLGAGLRRQKVPPLRRALLAALRGILLTLVVFLVLDPARYTAEGAKEDWLGVIVDVSGSMAVRDRGRNDSRLETVQKILAQSPEWKRTAALYPPRYFTFDQRHAAIEQPGLAKAGRGTSGLFHTLGALESRYGSDPNLLGWLLVSDGNATDAEAVPADFFKTMSRAVVAVAAGDEGPVPNLRMKLPEIRSPAFAGEAVPAKIEWEAAGGLVGKRMLTVKAGSQTLLQREVDVLAPPVLLEVPLTQPGAYPLTASLDTAQDEAVISDNSAEAWIEALPRKIKVFYAESFYKDENSFQKALEEDSDFEVHFAASLVGFAKEKRVPFILDPLSGLPQRRQDLMDYDVIVLSDVKKSLLKPEQMAWIREWVELHAGTLVMVGGLDSFGDGGYSGSPLEALLPVEISEEYRKEIYLKARGTVERPFRIELAPGAADHPLLQLSAEAEKNAALWAAMPPLGGYNYTGRLKPGAQLLWQHPADKSQNGPRVILAVQNFGKGRVLAFTSDITPNWGAEFLKWKDPEHGWLYARFWQHALKWLSRERLKARARPVEIERQPALAAEDEDLVFRAAVPGEPAAAGKGRFELFEGARRRAAFSFVLGPDHPQPEWHVKALPAGDYRLEVHLESPGEKKRSARDFFSVHASRRESFHLEARHELLARMAAGTGGAALDARHLQDLPQAIEKLRRRHLSEFARPVWNKVWLYALILSLLFGEWWLRKRQGLEG